MAVYNSRIKNWEDLDVTKEELDNITDCLKKAEFRKLLFEYAEEVTNPENKKLYEREIAQLEAERGVDVTFVNPEPGYVIKTSVDGSKKCFVNISQSDTVNKPSSQPSYDNGNKGLRWSIPYTLAPPRDDLDKKNARCLVFDVVFHPDTLHLASKNSQFRDTVNQTALDGVENSFRVNLDRNNVKFPKLSFKGVSQPTVIRKKLDKPVATAIDMEPEIYQKLMSSYDQSRAEKSAPKMPERPAPPTRYYKDGSATKIDAYTEPKFIIKHQDNVEIEDFGNHKNAKLLSAVPRKLVVVVDLPLLKTAEDTVLDVQERLVLLRSEKPAKYHLELPLPYDVDPDAGNATFDCKMKKLTITLPVVRRAVPLGDNGNREDSGVESDHGSPPEEKLVEIISREECEFSECEDTALRTNGNEKVDEFMNADIRYSLPQFTCNLYDKTIALTIHLKNVDADSVRHRIIDDNAGFHVLMTSVGAGFFPLYYSLCFRVREDSVKPESLTIEPWDNNVVVTISLRDDVDCENSPVNYSIGVDQQFMELKEFPNSESLRNKINKLMIGNGGEDTEKNVEVVAEGDDIVINITSANQLDSDDEAEREDTDSSRYDDHRSISESSGDELNGARGTAGRAKGILKCRRNHGSFARSVSESSVDDSLMLASSVDFHSDYTPEINSESGGSSLKKTVRFNDVVARQLYRSNSSILGQRKKNQRKLRNKKRAHDRRTSESENSESEERAEKYKVSNNKNESDDNDSRIDKVKPILNHDKSMVHQKSEHIDIDNKRSHCAHPTSKRNVENGSWDNDGDNESNVNGVKEVFKNDLIFDLDI